jgi:hypothetical protein
MRRTVDFTNPADVRRWLAALRTEVDGMIDLGHEATRKNHERVVPRAHIREELERTGAMLRRLLRAGRRGLPAKIPAPPPAPAPSIARGVRARVMPPSLPDEAQLHTRTRIRCGSRASGHARARWQR